MLNIFINQILCNVVVRGLQFVILKFKIFKFFATLTPHGWHRHHKLISINKVIVLTKNRTHYSVQVKHQQQQKKQILTQYNKIM